MYRFVAKMTPVENIKRRAEELLRPIIQERIDLLQEHGDDWPEQPVSIVVPTFHCRPLLKRS